MHAGCLAISTSNNLGYQPWTGLELAAGHCSNCSTRSIFEAWSFLPCRQSKQNVILNHGHLHELGSSCGRCESMPIVAKRAGKSLLPFIYIDLFRGWRPLQGAIAHIFLGSNQGFGITLKLCWRRPWGNHFFGSCLACQQICCFSDLGNYGKVISQPKLLFQFCYLLFDVFFL